MIWTNLGSPIPLETPSQYKPYEWPSQDLEHLLVPAELTLPSLEKVIERRRTRRSFGQLNREQLSSFLWLSCRTLAKGDDCIGFPITQRPESSAGAIHPIHLILGDYADSWNRYDPDQHALSKIGSDGSVLIDLWHAARKVVDPEEGTILVFVAEPGKTYAKYEFADSLIWRDAGALIGHMALVAEGLELDFCPLGITGEPCVSKLDNQQHLVGVGLAILGSRIST